MCKYKKLISIILFKQKYNLINFLLIYLIMLIIINI